MAYRTFVQFANPEEPLFWNIRQNKQKLFIVDGPFGYTGEMNIVTCKSIEEAEQQHKQLIEEKLQAGYIETTAHKETIEPDPTRQSLEEALIANPDDLGSHMAYPGLFSNDATK